MTTAIISNVSNTSICIVCGNEYKVYQPSRQKYCSSNCRVKGNRLIKDKRFSFLKEEFQKPKKQVLKSENKQWSFLNQQERRHSLAKSELQKERERLTKNLTNLASQNKAKLIGLAIGLGVTTIAGYILINIKKDSGKRTVKDNITDAVKIPIGAIIAFFALIGGGIGYGIAAALPKSNKVIQRINEMNNELKSIDEAIRLEEMNLEDIKSQIVHIPQYDEIREIELVSLVG